ncbi:MAG: M42 family metallopeptidase [Clostridia bacterium]
MIDFILQKLKELTSIDSPSGFTFRAKEYVLDELKSLGYAPQENKKGCVFCDLGGSGNPLILSAHIDTLGGMVAEVKANGRLKLTKIGGLRPENIETENCKVWTRGGKTVEGTFQLNNPSIHVNGNYATTPRDFDNMEVVLDEKTTNKADTLALGIEVGDYVCFDPRTVVTKSGYIKSRFLDDKLSVAILLGVAKYIKDNKVNLNRKVVIFISVYEEIGHGASSLPFDIEEMLCVDMGCVGEGLNCTERECSICVKDSAGPSNFEMTSKLVDLAKKNKIAVALDVYPFYSSDADAGLSAGNDFKHCLIGAGVYASHGYERSHVDGVTATLDLIVAYLSE